MNIALIGYGKMGKAIEEEALQRGHQIVLKLDQNRPLQHTADLKNADVAIEFTNPDAAFKNINSCFDAQVPVVVGTTGWYDKFAEIEAHCEQKNGTLFHATNFSLGVNIMFEMNKQLSNYMKQLDTYQVAIKEIHHTQKLDAPSGTAISLAEQIMASNPAYKKWSLKEGVISDKQIIPIAAERSDEVPGTHYVEYTSAIDSIGLYHIAHNRKGFALGAVIAAEFILAKKGVYNMSYLINQIIKNGN